MTTLKELRSKAQSATPGPWQVDCNAVCAFIPDEGEECILLETGYGFAEDADYQFIAASNPETVLELLDRLEKAETALDDIMLQVAYVLEENTDANRTDALSHIGAKATLGLTGLSAPLGEK